MQINVGAGKVGATSFSRSRVLLAFAVAGVLFLALYNLTEYPLTWYDEGSHLHVPKTLLRFGQYADYSSEGFRYYGPTIGVGPTVLLPIAGVFAIFGLGLMQARLVIVIYLLATIVVFYRLADHLGRRRFAWAALALFVTSRGVGVFEYGRQVLGEVPGLFFIVSGLLVWFTAWERREWWRLTAVGALLGLAVVTKTQYFIVVAPTLALGWIANLIYYRTAPQRVFIVPGFLVGVFFALWQSYVVVFLGPGAVSENLALYRAATASAATVFDFNLMKRSVSELLSLKVYLGWLLPALAYGFVLALPKRRDGQQWGMLLILAMVNLIWYVVASIGWIRYAFPALALSSLFVAQFFHDLTGGYKLDVRAFRQGGEALQRHGLRLALLAMLVVMIALPLAQTTADVVFPPFNGPKAMAAYLDQNVPPTALIETWEPEIGFLTDLNYHFPPQAALYQAVSYIWLGKTPPSENYQFVWDNLPDYVLVGAMARWVGMYPVDKLAEHYSLVTTVGAYELYALNK
jgi:4-amino-4-deoxy-L-arabinose transferase-like glycosyltransferase